MYLICFNFYGGSQFELIWGEQLSIREIKEVCPCGTILGKGVNVKTHRLVSPRIPPQ